MELSYTVVEEYIYDCPFCHEAMSVEDEGRQNCLNDDCSYNFCIHNYYRNEKPESIELDSENARYKWSLSENDKPTMFIYQNDEYIGSYPCELEDFIRDEKHLQEIEQLLINKGDIKIDYDPSPMCNCGTCSPGDYTCVRHD